MSVCAGSVEGMKRILLVVPIAAALALAACSTNSAPTTSETSTSASAASSTPAATNQSVLNAEQIAKGQQLSNSGASLTWFNEVGQAGACGKFSKEWPACEAKAWDLMSAYIDAELELYNGFKSTMAPGECLTQIDAQIADLNSYKTVMTKIHAEAQNMDEKAMRAEASKLPTPTATNFAQACGVTPSSGAASGSPAAPASETPSPSAS